MLKSKLKQNQNWSKLTCLKLEHTVFDGCIDGVGEVAHVRGSCRGTFRAADAPRYDASDVRCAPPRRKPLGRRRLPDRCPCYFSCSCTASMCTPWFHASWAFRSTWWNSRRSPTRTAARWTGCLLREREHISMSCIRRLLHSVPRFRDHISFVNLVTQFSKRILPREQRVNNTLCIKSVINNWTPWDFGRYHIWRKRQFLFQLT